LSEWAEILQGFTKSKIQWLLKISALYLDKQKILFLKRPKVYTVPCTMDSSDAVYYINGSGSHYIP
jgi:hypothetical protein